MARFQRHQTSHQKLSIHRGRNIATVTLIATIVVGLAVGLMLPRYFTRVYGPLTPRAKPTVWPATAAPQFLRNVQSTGA